MIKIFSQESLNYVGLSFYSIRYGIQLELRKDRRM